MPQKSKKEPKLLTLKQACELLNCHPNTLRAWDEKGYLVAVRFGTRRDRRYRREDVMKLLKKLMNRGGVMLLKAIVDQLKMSFLLVMLTATKPRLS